MHVLEEITIKEVMFSVFNFSTLTMGTISDVFSIDFVLKKNNLVEGVYGVFDLVSYRNRIIEVALLCLD